MCDTVTFFPTTIPFLQVNLTDYLKQVASDIVTILTQSSSKINPSLEAGNPIYNTLLTSATQLKIIDKKPTPL